MCLKICSTDSRLVQQLCLSFDFSILRFSVLLRLFTINVSMVAMASNLCVWTCETFNTIPYANTTYLFQWMPLYSPINRQDNPKMIYPLPFPHTYVCLNGNIQNLLKLFIETTCSFFSLSLFSFYFWSITNNLFGIKWNLCLAQKYNRLLS